MHVYIEPEKTGHSLKNLLKIKVFSRAVAFALISGTKEISDTLAMAALLFSGGLSVGYPLAATLFLCGTIVIRASVGLLSTMPHAVGSPDHKTGMSIIAGLLGGIVVMAANPEAGVVTALAICGATSMMTGFLFVVVGTFRLAHFARLLPYPVLGGFLAGSGWLLAQGGFLMALRAEPDKPIADVWHVFSLLSDPQRLAVVLPSLLFAVLMFFVVRRKVSAAPILIIGGIGIFYFFIVVSGIGIDNARTFGWLPALEDNGTIIQPNLAILGQIDWAFLVKALPLMFFAAALSTVSMLLNVSSLSLRLRADVDVNREMLTAGFANIAIGSFGGMATYISTSSTSLAYRLGVDRVSAAISVVAVLVFAVAFAGQIASSAPIFLTSGMVLFAGLDFLVEWIIASKRRLPLLDWMLIISIFAVIVFFGILPGILIGILLSVVLFVVNYARISVIRTSGSLKEWRSHVDRSTEESDGLAMFGGACEILSLQGYLFFATAELIVDHVRKRVQNDQAGPLRFLVLDFRHVGGCDLAAIAAFANIINISSKNGFRLLFSGMSVEVKTLFDRSRMIYSSSDRISDFVDVDHAIEFCEEAILAEGAFEDSGAFLDAETFLSLKIGKHPDLPSVLDKFRKVCLTRGDYLIRKGEAADDVFVVLSGRVHVQIDLPDGRTLRLRTMTPGAIVGDVALYTGQRRTADVFVDEDTTVLCLSAASLAEIEHSYGNLAAAIHRIFARTLAEKLVLANNAIRLAQR